MSNRNALFGNIICGECGDIYRRYNGKEGTAVPKTKWRCRARTIKYSDCRGRAITEDELKNAIVKAFNALPRNRDKLIRMQERIPQSKSLQAQTLWNTERCKAHEIRTESVKPQLKAIRDCGII